jgi:hypothetical protein
LVATCDAPRGRSGVRPGTVSAPCGILAPYAPKRGFFATQHFCNISVFPYEIAGKVAETNTFR